MFTRCSVDRQISITRREMLAGLAALGGVAVSRNRATAQTGLPLPPAQVPLGYNVLQNTDSMALVHTSILRNPNVAGIVLRRRWSALNPSFGVYDWSYLDREISRAKSYGKQVQLVVFTGVSAPSWLYAGGVQSLQIQDSRYPGQTFTMPVPWDPTMLSQWGVFLAALGARYDGDPVVSLVHACGPCRFSCEMFVPVEATQVVGWSNAAIISAWTQVVAYYNVTFPNTAVSFNMSHAIAVDDGVPQAVAAMATATLLDRATLQLDSLSPRTSQSYDIQALLLSYAQLGFRIGYEMVSQSKESRFGGPFSAAVAVAHTSGAQFVNLYPSDVGQLVAPY